MTDTCDALAAQVPEEKLSVTDAGAVWQPYVDRPLLTPSMLLGLEHVSTHERQRLQRYLAALVAARRGPVHVNVAFNACYFGYDLTAGSYVGGALNDLFAFPAVDVRATCGALPVGALINITAGTHPLFAEVVYKEGAHPALRDDGSLPDWLSGAPAGGIDQRAAGEQATREDPPGAAGGAVGTEPVVLRERLVVDIDAFGEHLSVTPEQLARIRRQGRGLDSDGHLLLDAQYRSRGEADLDDLSFFAKYLLTEGRDQLLSASAPMPLATVLTDDAGDAELEAALLGLLHTIEEALTEIGELRLWRGYAFTRASLGARLNDSGPLGGDELGSIATQLGRLAVPNANRRFAPARTIAYTAIGPRLRMSAGAGPQLTGVGYAAAVCHANAVVSDYARRDAGDDGLLPDQVHLRLDDPWQGGGVWRAEHPGSAWVNVEMTQPLGLGWLSSLPASVDPPSPAGEPGHQTPEAEVEPKPPEEDQNTDAADVTNLVVTNSQVSWTQPLRLGHQLKARLPLPDGVASQMRASGGPASLRLLLTHDGYDLDLTQAQQETKTELYGPAPELAGVDWPLEFFPGIVLICTWPRGGSVVRATSTLLDAPVTVDGFEIEHRYDPSILTRDAAPGAPHRRSDTTGASTTSAGTLTLTERILRAVRRLGLLTPDGSAVLVRTHLPPAVYGPGVAAEPDTQCALEEAVAELLASGDLVAETASVATNRKLQYPAAPGQPPCQVLVYTPQVVGAAARTERRSVTRTLNPRFLRTTDVSGHLRYIAHLGWEAGEAARAAYREDCARFGLVGPAELPAGYTYVSPFRRGG